MATPQRPSKSWFPALRPEEVREGCEEDLRGLRREVLDVVHLRFMGNAGVPFLESLDALIDLKKQGKVRHIALSNVNKAHLEQALERTPVVAVQNLFNVAGGAGRLAEMAHAKVEAPEAVLEACEARNIAYLPFFPLAVGTLGGDHPVLSSAARRHGVTTAQVALAWLLARSPVMLPIPGTSSPEHLEENWAARLVALSADEVERIAREARAEG